MKTQKYLVTIEMPDGDMIGPGWIKDIIQADCDVEDAGRQKVSVEEIKEETLGKTLDEAAEKYASDYHAYDDEQAIAEYAFTRGATWMAEQGVSYFLIPNNACILQVPNDIRIPVGEEVIVQIRKKED